MAATRGYTHGPVGAPVARLPVSLERWHEWLTGRAEALGAARRRHASAVARQLLPAAALLAVVILDLTNGPHEAVLGLLASVPLLAASLLAPRGTAAYGAGALLFTALDGVIDHAYRAAAADAQWERLAFVLAMSLVAVRVSAVRVRRERRLRAVTSVAETVQQALLPDPPERLGPMRLVASYQSAAEEARIGGDFFDVCPSDWGTRLVIGDVRGKGLGAVRTAVAVMAAFRERAGERHDLAELVRDLDRTVKREAQGGEEFVTAAVAELNGGSTLRVALAGHPAPLVLRRKGAKGSLCLARVAPPLGVATGPLCPAVSVTSVHPGDRVLFFTDGSTEARDHAGRFFPLTAAAAELMADRPLDDAVRDLEAALRRWTGGRLGDDAALLALEVSP